jgi:hypothetical protein
MNYELEKLRIAKEWLETRTPGSQEWEAAWEHVLYVARFSMDRTLRLEALVFADKVLGHTLPSTRTDK